MTLVVILCLSTLSSIVLVFQPGNMAVYGYNEENQGYTTSNSSNDNFTIIVLPDIQGYSRYYPWIADNQTQWIVDNKEALNIVFVSQLGDLVDRQDNITEWENANSSLSKLDGNVPWAVLPGNHDAYNHNLTAYNEYFGQDRFSSYGWYGGSYVAGDNSNSYQLFSAGGTDYLIFHLEYNPTDDVLYWASNIIDAYPDRKVIISTHDYLMGFAKTGQRSDVGERIWHSLVKPHADQVFLVLCGHTGIEDLITDNVNGNVVYQVLADFQNDTNIESGWLRILQFCPSQDKIFVKTYSPLLNQYKNGSESEFTLDYKTVNALPAKPEGTTNENNTIYIRQDGTVEPSTAPIQRDGAIYTFKDNIFGSIIIEKDNVVIDGAGFTLRGTGAEDYRPSVEIDLTRLDDPNYWFSRKIPDPYITPDSNNTGIYSNAQGLTIKNLKITECWCAIELEYSSDNGLTQNQIIDNTQGIWIHYSSSNTISNNNIDDNKQAITLTTSHGTIKNNNITNTSEYGIKLQWSFNNILENNISGKGYGICLEGSSRNIFKANRFSEVKQVFSNSNWNYPENIQDVDTSNLVGGKPIYYWINKQEMTVPNDAGWVALINCTKIKIENLNLMVGQEILLVRTMYSTVTRNALSNNSLCIGLYESASNIIAENSLTDSYYGIRLQYSNDNDIKQNTIAGCNQGISLDSCSKNRIQLNNISNGTQGLDLSLSTNNLVYGNTLTENKQGLCLIGTSVSYTINDTVFYKSSNNNITANNILENDCGIYIFIAENNSFTLNNLENNTSQVEIKGYSNSIDDDNNATPESVFANVWDNGTLGNYWSDYTSKYPNASESASGTWNTSYVIGEANQDNYPLKQPIKPVEEQTEIPIALILFAVPTAIAAIIGITGFAYFKKRKKQI